MVDIQEEDIDVLTTIQRYTKMFTHVLLSAEGEIIHLRTSHREQVNSIVGLGSRVKQLEAVLEQIADGCKSEDGKSVKMGAKKARKLARSVLNT